MNKDRLGRYSFFMGAASFVLLFSGALSIFSPTIPFILSIITIAMGVMSFIIGGKDSFAAIIGTLFGLVVFLISIQWIV